VSEISNLFHVIFFIIRKQAQKSTAFLTF